MIHAVVAGAAGRVAGRIIHMIHENKDIKLYWIIARQRIYMRLFRLKRNLF